MAVYNINIVLVHIALICIDVKTINMYLWIRLYDASSLAGLSLVFASNEDIYTRGKAFAGYFVPTDR